MTNEVAERHEQTQTLLQEIRDRLPSPSEPLQVRSNDQAALNANLDAIANGTVTVLPAETIVPVYDKSVKQIDSTDQAAMNANLEAIADGRAVVTEGVRL